jgi:hypothetical protein
LAPQDEQEMDSGMDGVPTNDPAFLNNPPDYLFRWLPPDCGKAVELTKLAEDGRNEVYHVLLGADGGASCDCKGFLRWDHCKHAEGLLALLNR